MTKTALVISYHFSADGSVASHRTIGFVKSLQQAGFEVSVLCCKELTVPSRDEKVELLSISNPLLKFINRFFVTFKDSSKAKKRHSEIAKKGSFIRLINNFRKDRGILFLGRMPDVSDIWYFIVKKHLKKREEKWDVVVSSYAPYSNLLIGSYLKKKNEPKCL